MELLSTFSILIISSIFLIWLYIKKKFSYWKNRGVETVNFSYLWGDMKGAVLQQESFTDIMLRLYREFKSKGIKYGGVYLMWFPIYFPLDIDIIKSIMQVDFQHFVDRGVYYNEKTDPLTAHLFSLEGKRWRLLRQKLTPTFTSGKMRMMFETLVDCTTGLYKVMDKEVDNAVDIKDILGRFTTDAIGSCAFGLDCNSLENPNSEFRVKGKEIFHKDFWGNVIQFMSLLVPNFLKRFNIKTIPSDVEDFFMNVVKDNVAYREKNDVFRKDFMHLLIQLKNKGQLVDDENIAVENITEDENNITIEEIAAQAFIFFEAGFETSSTAMTFCLYELAKNKDIQDKVRQEIRKVLKMHDDKLTYDAAMNMHYLEQTINESMRKYPPIPSLNRKCTKEYKVPGTDFILEKGEMVFIPVIGIHYDPEYYPDPEKFDPDRFSEENKKTRPGFTFLPFGDGPRACIGNRFGMMQTKVGLIALLLNYEFTVSKKTKEPLEYSTQSFVPTTKGDMWLDFKKISPETIELLPQKAS